MTKFKTIVLLLVSCCSLAAFALPNDKDEVLAKTSDLKILSWNIYMLPALVPMAGRMERAQAIGDTLLKSDYDIIVFQEAFHKKAVGTIRKKLAASFPYMYGPFNEPKRLDRINSGVWIVSKTPLKLLNTVKFPAGRGSDYFSYKGAALMEGSLPNGKTFQILGTHMQSEFYPEIRKVQFDMMYKELLSVNKKEGVPQIICGDMNTETLIKEEYCNMLECLDAENGQLEGVQKETYDGAKNELITGSWKKHRTTFDYILLRHNGAKISRTERKVSVLKKRLKNGKKDLSDHYGVICEVKFDSPTPVPVSR